jgi:hypothetical protein
MYSRAIGSTSRGKRACVSPPSLGMWTIHHPPAAVAGDVDIEAGHWSLSDEAVGWSSLTSTRSATRRFKWTVPARRDVQAADRGDHHCRAMTIKQLRNASDDDLIDEHDHAARYASPGVSYYLDELRRRDTARARALAMS